MNKFLQKVAKLFLGISMAAGVGLAVENKSKAAPVEAADTFTKVTAAPSDWSGTYLIAYVSNSTANVWTGVDANSNFAAATITNGKITQPTNGRTVTIASMSGGYSIRVNGGTNDGKYISGTSGSNTTNFNASAVANTLTYSSGVDIASNTSHFVFNSTSGTTRFRYYKSTTYSGSAYKKPDLFKLDETKTLSSISVSGYTTAFTQYDTFSFGGTVTAHYSDSTTANVTSSATFSGYNMSTASNQTVTVSYTEGGTTKTATYSITVAAHTHTYSNEWSSDGTHHWHAATCGHDVKDSYAEHTYVNHICSVCGAEEPNEIIDTLDSSVIPAAAVGSSTSSWGTASTFSDVTGAIYTGRFMGVSSNSFIGRLNDSTNGYIYTSTVPSNMKLVSVSIESMTASKTVGVYAQSGAYSSAPSDKSTALGTISPSSLTYTFAANSNYNAICLRGHTSATEIGTVTITYQSLSSDTGYSVTYKPGTGTGTDYELTGQKGTYTFLGNDDTNISFTAPQYCEFGGWSVVVGSASAVVKQPTETISLTDNVVATAIWNDTRSTLTLAASGAGGATSVEAGSTLELTITATSGQTTVTGLTYTCISSNESYATVTNAGVITGVAAGSSVITISFGGNATYKAASTTFNVTVNKRVVPLPASGTISIIGTDISGTYGTDTPYVVEEDSTTDSEFGFNCTNVMKNTTDLQFRGSNGVLYSTTPLSYLLSVTVSGDNSGDADIKYGTTSNNGCTSSNIGTTNTYFKISNTSSNARYWQVTITYGTPVTLSGISVALDSTASEKTYYEGDTISVSDVDVTTSYSNSDLDSTIEDGTGVYFNSAFTQTTYELSEGTNNISVYYKDNLERSANATLTVSNVQPPKTVQAWTIEGSIGETTKSTSYNLSGLTLHAWYDSGKTDEAPSSVAELYELVPNPTTAGSTSDPNNKISVEVYLKTDTGHSNLLATFTNVAAPIVDAPKGSAENPYTVAEAMAAITWDTNTSTTEMFYAVGYVKNIVSANTNHGYYLVDDPDDTTSSNKDCLEAYSRSEPTGWDTSAYGDKVTVYGCLTYYNGQKEIGSSSNGFTIIDVDAETLSLDLSVTEETVIFNSSYSYSGTITANYKHRTDVVYDGSDSRFTITSTVNTAVVGEYSYSVTYDDDLFEAITESCTVTVQYASVSSITINGSSTVDMYINDIHEFTVSFNSGVNPSTSVTWNVTNGQGSSFVEGTSNDYEMVEGILETHTSKTGTLIVTATAGGVTSSPVTVSITGNPVPTLDSSDLYGFAGDQGTLEASVVGGVAPYTYSWEITGTSGVASLNEDYGIIGNDVVIDYEHHGDTIVTLTVTDSQNNVGTVTANIHVSGLLNTVASEDSTEEVSATTTFSTMSLENNVKYSSLTCPSNSDITFAFGDGANDGKYYTTGAAIRVYGGGHMTVSHASKTITKIVLTFASGEGSNTITTNVGSYSSGTWTGSSSSVTFNVGGTSNHRRIASVQVFWEVTTPGSSFSNLDAKAQKSVLDFAMLFNSGFEDGESPICTGVGTTNTTALASAWADLADTFGNWFNEGDLGLTSQEIENAFALFAYADSVDQNVTSSADDLQHMLAKYDYIMAHYGESLHLTDFLHDSAHRAAVAQSPHISPLVNIIGENTNTVAIIVIISMVSVTAIGGYFFLRKRKEDLSI